MTNSEKKKQVVELLNQIVILTQEVKEPQSIEDYNYNSKYVTSNVLSDLQDGDTESYVSDDNGKPIKEVDDDAVYLYCVNSYAKRVLAGDANDAAHNEDKYYTSTC